MNGQQVVHRGVGRHHHGTGGNHRTRSRFDAGMLAAFDLRRMGVGVDAAAIPDDGLCQSRQILQGMKLPLARKPQSRSGIERTQRCTRDQFNIRQTRAMHGGQLAFEGLTGFSRRGEEVAVHAFEITIDLLLNDDVFDLIYGRGVALRDEPRPRFSVQLFQFEIAGVQSDG